ncbi:MAG TPA: hypothetical protein VMT20_09800 [Terriglobia bacterium]|nr:hypothetical protein [Terriglobia bacterium]
MAVKVFCNTIALPTYRDSVRGAVLEGIGERPPNEDWMISIFEPQDRPDYIVKIEGPNNFRWERDFFGPTEQTPEFIKHSVKEAIAKPAPVNYEPVIERLLQRSEEGKVPWEKAGSLDNEFVSTLEVGGGRTYRFHIKKVDGAYLLRMTDAEQNEIFSLSAEAEILFGPWQKQARLNQLREIFELARRKVFSVDQKLADVVSLLDAI